MCEVNSLKFKGTNLILDNFRNVLSDYSIDIQDIVRSAILDDIDISSYIEECKLNPLRLEQIRLGLKEGLDSSLFNIKSGDCLYKIRKLDFNLLNMVVAHLKFESLSDELILKLIDWIKKGYNLKGIRMSYIPKGMYDLFEKGLKQGYDMRVFNTGEMYSEDYISYCFVMLSNKKSIKPFIKDANGWNLRCLKLLSKFSRVSVDKWNLLLKYVDSSTGYDKLKLIIECVKNNIPIKELCKSNVSEEAINIILKAYSEGLDYNKLILVCVNSSDVLSAYNDMSLRKLKRVGGRLRK